MEIELSLIDIDRIPVKKSRCKCEITGNILKQYEAYVEGQHFVSDVLMFPGKIYFASSFVSHAYRLCAGE